MRPAAALHGRARVSGRALARPAWPAARSCRARPPRAGLTAGEGVHRDVQAPAAEVEAHFHRDLLAQRGLRAAPRRARPRPAARELRRPCTVWRDPCHEARGPCQAENGRKKRSGQRRRACAAVSNRPASADASGGVPRSRSSRSSGTRPSRSCARARRRACQRCGRGRAKECRHVTRPRLVGRAAQGAALQQRARERGDQQGRPAGEVGLDRA
jgi:hypothetical protein